jgi:hypothetical protein
MIITNTDKNGQEIPAISYPKNIGSLFDSSFLMFVDSPKTAISRSAVELQQANDKSAMTLSKIRRKQHKSETDLIAFDSLLAQLDFDLRYLKFEKS